MKRSFGTLVFSILFFLSVFNFDSLALTKKSTEFWLGIPKVDFTKNELYSGESPYQLAIHADLGARVTVQFFDSTISDKNLILKKDETYHLPLDINLMHKDNEVKTNKGIHVVSDLPVTVTLMVTYKNSGEACRILPMEYLGKTYYTLNLYEDKTELYKEPEILIIGTQKNTKIKYTPTAKTLHSENKAPITINLDAGDSYLIESFQVEALLQDMASDLTGTKIESDKPIAVISGHEKGAYPKLSPTAYGAGTDWGKNLLMEMMPPLDFLDTLFFMAPMRFPGRTFGIVSDDRGDLIRAVATQDSTIIYKYRENVGTLTQVTVLLKAGDEYDFTSQFLPVCFASNKPVLVGQYGKSWISATFPTLTKEKRDTPQANPVDAGEGFMLTLLPRSMWQNYSVIDAIPDKNNYLYMTFKSSDSNNIFFDGKSLTQQFKNEIKQIASPYSVVYITAPITAGIHKLTTANSASFAAYVYGVKDGIENEYAYGYTAAFDIPPTVCNDSIFVIDTIDACGNIKGIIEAKDLDMTGNCALIQLVKINTSNSYNFEFQNTDSSAKKISFKINVIDKTKPAKLDYYGVTASGSYVGKTYTYEPEQISSLPTSVDFGKLLVGAKTCKTIKINNTGKVPVAMKALHFDNSAISLDNTNSLPFIIDSGESKDLSICINPSVDTSVTMTGIITAELSCSSVTVDTIKYKTGLPIAVFDDLVFKDIQLGTEKSLGMSITNKGTYELVIDSASWNDKVHFKINAKDLPLKLPANSKINLLVYYKPDSAGVENKTRATFYTNTSTEKLYSDWTGNSIGTGIDDISSDGNLILYQNVPNPVSGNTSIKYYTERPGNIKISIFNYLGAKVIDELINSNYVPGEYEVNLDINNYNLTDGLYYYVLESGSVRLTRFFVINK